MSTATNEAATRPDNYTDEDSNLEDEQGQDIARLAPSNKAEALLEEEEATLSSVRLNAQNDTDAPPYQLYQPVQSSSPDIVEGPSSADGSLSNPDDTPSLQVSRSNLLTVHCLDQS